MSTSADPSHMQDTPPARALLRLITGYWVSRAIYVMAKLGIADLLRDGPQGSDGLAQATGTDARALYRVLRTLASVGVLVEDEAARFGLTPMGACLQTGVPGSFRAWAISTGEENYRAWAEVLYSVHTGKSAFEQVFGMGVYDYRAHHPEAAARFNEGMTDWTRQAAPAVAAAYDFSVCTRVVDVGGGARRSPHRAPPSLSPPPGGPRRAAPRRGGGATAARSRGPGESLRGRGGGLFRRHAQRRRCLHPQERH
jgi:hypothetical protein